VSAAIGDGAFVVTELMEVLPHEPGRALCAAASISPERAGEYNPFKKGQVVRFADGTTVGTWHIAEVLNAQQVRLEEISAPVDVRKLEAA
jgi:hypothetical protein